MTKGPSLTLGILMVDCTPETLSSAHGSFQDMIIRWLGLHDAYVAIYQADDGHLPASPDAADFWIISGSPAGVYEDLPWIAPLESFVRDCHAVNSPMFGICFGHQLIAQALGGRVAKSVKGWGLGVQDCEIQSWPAALGTPLERISLQSFHQDQIEDLPAEAEVLAASSFCPTAVLWYPDWAFSVQGHPEFSRAFNSDLIKSYEDRLLAKPLAQGGFARAQLPDNRADLAQVVRGWVRTLKDNLR